MGGDPAKAGEEPVYAGGYLKEPRKPSLTLELALKGTTAARVLLLVCCLLSAVAPRRKSVRSQTI